MMPVIHGKELPAPLWDDLTLDVVLEYYDGPRLLLQKSSSGQMYLAWWSHEDGPVERWIYLPVSRPRLEEILSGEVASLEALDRPESGHIYLVDIDTKSDSIIRTVRTESSAISDSFKPMPGARLRLPMPPEIDDARTEKPTGRSVPTVSTRPTRESTGRISAS
ncbi:MAG: hypothetical protein F4Z35_01020 [Dehalococcoidia bacterium]|nr:hypothetical protein [Dehalococcoidia bacterium]